MSSTVIAPLPPMPSQAAAFAAYLPPWIYPPAAASPFDFINYIDLPAQDPALFTTIISFQVPPQYNGIIRAYANKFIGGGFEDGSGDIIWQILHNDGSVPVRFYNRIIASLGDPVNPTYHPMGIRIMENETIKFVVRNANIVPASQRIGARLAGWFYPKSLENPGVRV